jgi:diguanylate cyclase (GGDEF)-like protein
MAIWAFTYSFANTAPTAEAAAFWKNMAASGWGTFYSIIFHFFLVFTKTKIRLNKRMALTLIYVPALVNIILFAPFGLFPETQDQMVRADFGWANVSPLNPARIWFIVYYGVFSVASILTLVRWWKKAEPNTPLKRQITYFLISVLVPFFLGISTETLPQILGAKIFPNLTIIFLMIPISTIFIASRKFGLILEKQREMPLNIESTKPTNIDRLRLYQVTAVMFMLGSALSFLVGHFGIGRPLKYELTLSLSMFATSVFILYLPSITRKHTVQDAILLAICSAGAVVLMVTNADTGGVTIWAAYILFLLITIALDNKMHALLFTVLCVAIEIVFAILLPKIPVIINRNEYITRIFLIILSYFFVYYLTNEYAYKLQGYQRYAKAQKTLESISTSLISVNNDNIREKVDEMFKMSAEIIEFDLAYLVLFSADYQEATILNMYKKDGSIGTLPFSPNVNIRTAALPMAKPIIEQRQAIAREDTINIPIDEGSEARDYFTSRGIYSYYASPILDDEKVIGMLVFEYCSRSRLDISESRLYFLGILANMLADAKKKNLYEEQLYNYAYFDESTKLANRNMLTKTLKHIIDSRKESENIAVLYIEIENLRTINDTFGHRVGEQIVIKSAAILKNLLGEPCYISRTDEGAFAVVLPDAEDEKQIKKCVTRITDAFTNPIQPTEGIEALFVGINIGISVYPQGGRDADTLLQNADLAGYEARFAEDRVVFYSDHLKSRVEENTLLINRLFTSLQNDEFSLEFQPQISCGTEKTAGIEALLRWTTSDNKRIPPNVFIPLLEQMGLIHDVGLWVLEQALKQHNKLIAQGFPPLRVSVNLSLAQFQGKDIVSDFKKIIEESGVNPKYIELEITESMLFENFPDTVKKLFELKELGINITIDDFGRGYSSLYRLESIPFSRIKIDKSIVDEVPVKEKKTVIAKAIVSLAKTLMAEITAEGVETKEQVDFLKNIACDEIQGYYFSRPLSAEALEEFLRKEVPRTF